MTIRKGDSTESQIRTVTSRPGKGWKAELPKQSVWRTIFRNTERGRGRCSPSIRPAHAGRTPEVSVAHIEHRPQRRVAFHLADFPVRTVLQRSQASRFID